MAARNQREPYMGTIIEFPADAALRRPGSTMDGASGDGMGTITDAFPLSGSNAKPRRPRWTRDRKRVQRPAAGRRRRP